MNLAAAMLVNFDSMRKGLTKYAKVGALKGMFLLSIEEKISMGEIRGPT